MAWDYYEYKIAEHFIFALEYGEYGDVDEKEIAEFQAWVETEQDRLVGHWSIEENDGDDFGRCAVTGLFASRATVRFNFKVRD